MGLFSSDYQDKMFIPFVNTFLTGNNPYTVYYENNLPASFSYFPLMLLIESIGAGILRLFGTEVSLFLTNVVFKLPLLIFDIIGYLFIRKADVRFKYAFIFYFCSPIILYSVYMHGQLDIIPTTFFIAALYYLLKRGKKYNLIFYGIFLGFALSTKFHILAAVPIPFFYIAKREGIKDSVYCHAISLLVLLALTISFWGTGFIKTVLFNKEQAVLLSITYDYISTEIIIPLFILTLIYLKVLELNYFNRNLLVSMTGVLFSVFLICIPPMPAWFTWIVPFIAMYFSFVEEDKHKIMFIYGIFNLLYLIYFIFLHETSYTDLYFLGNSLQNIKTDNYMLKYIIFTFLSATLFVIIYNIYKFGIAGNNFYKRKGKSFTIGIAGDSGTGKTTLLKRIETLFSPKDILFIEGDGDHRWVRKDENWNIYTSLNPKANYLYRQFEDIKKLKKGVYVERTDYDHDTGSFSEKKRVFAKKYVILCGLHSLYLPQLRDVLDLKIYMDTDEELRKFWKIRRDTETRGYSKKDSISQIERRYPDAEKYIYPQKEFADLTITYFDHTLHNCYMENHTVLLSVRFILKISIDLEPVVSAFELYNISPEWRISDDFTHQELIFNGDDLSDKKIDFEDIAEKNIPQYKDMFASTPRWGYGIEGIVQLIVLLIISNKLRA